jgi:hypothetical protein
MAANIGPSAMPYVKDNKAPHFAGEVGEQLEDFLREYEELATTCTLTDRQKVKTILHYVPHKLQYLWKVLDGYSAHDWNAFRLSLEGLYQATSTQAKYSLWAFSNIIQFSCKNLANQISQNSRLNWIILENARSVFKAEAL